MGYVEQGKAFEGDTNYIPDRITKDARTPEEGPQAPTWPVEPGRYRLVAARACPWANRAIIVRGLLGLEDVISMGLCGPVQCNHNKLSENARDLFQTPGFGDTIDFEQIKAHYHRVHTDVNPSGIVPKGPLEGWWLTPHRRERL